MPLEDPVSSHLSFRRSGTPNAQRTAAQMDSCGVQRSEITTKPRSGAFAPTQVRSIINSPRRADLFQSSFVCLIVPSLSLNSLHPILRFTLTFKSLRLDPNAASSGWDNDPVTGVQYQRNLGSVLTWSQARKSCQQQGADLLSIVELHEQSYISGTESTREFHNVVCST